MATIAPDADRIGSDRIDGEQVTVTVYRQQPIEEQGRQGGKQDRHHHIAEEMSAGRNAQAGHKDDHAGGDASHRQASAPLQPGPDEHAERQEETGDQRGFAGRKRAVRITLRTVLERRREKLLTAEFGDAEWAGATDSRLQHTIDEKPGTKDHRPAQEGPHSPAGSLQRTQPKIADKDHESQKSGKLRTFAQRIPQPFGKRFTAGPWLLDGREKQGGEAEIDGGKGRE